jgi:hypothetical protein
MKLYTEEQLKRAMLEYTSYSKPTMIQVIDTLTPIELPSDEHIYNILRGKKMFEKDWGFIEGAKWMKEQILNQNK